MRARALLNVLAFSVAWAVVLFAARLLLKRPPVAVADTKLAQFAAIKDEIDVLVIGSSCVYRDFVPKVFDAELARAGVQARSFNFGLPGMQAPEVRARLRELFDLAPARLRCVVVDLQDTFLEIPERNRQTARTLDWHSPRQTAWLLDVIAHSSEPWPVKLAQARSHLVPFATALFLLGRGSDEAQRALGGGTPGDGMLEPSAESRGWVPLEAETAEECRVAARELTTRAQEYRQYLAYLRTPRPRADVWFEVDRRILTAIQDDVLERGAIPVFLITPDRSPYHHLVQLHERGWLKHLVAFNDPDRYSQFYRPSHRYDLAHLNRNGASEFSLFLARQMRPILDGNGGR
jgi:hypothetical protein